MAYTPENKLKRIQEVQEFFKAEYRPGMVMEYVFHQSVYPKFKISLRTFYSWLKVDVKTELKKLEDEKRNHKAQQISMDNFWGTSEADNDGSTS